MFNSVLRASLITYLATVIALWFSLQQTSTSDALGRTDLALALLTLCFALGFPVFTCCFLRRKQEKLREPDFKLKYESLYTNVDYYKKGALSMTTYYLLRRLLFAFTIVFFGGSIVCQIMIADAMSTGLLIFFITVRPMQDGLNNAI